MNIQRQAKNKKSITPVIAMVVFIATLIAGSYVLAAHRYTWWPFTQSVDQEARVTKDNLKDTTYGSDKTHSSSANESEYSNTKTGNPSNTTKKVEVGIASARVDGSIISVRAFVNDIIEGDGTCTASFTNGDHTITGSSPAFIDASTSQCEPIEISTLKFQENGIWKLTVEYRSKDASGTSATMDLVL